MKLLIALFYGPNCLFVQVTERQSLDIFFIPLLKYYATCSYHDKFKNHNLFQTYK